MRLKLLNLGCGRRIHPDWTNVDLVSTMPGVIAHDLHDRLPFEDSAFDAVYHSHILEHLPRVQALPFLRECNRLLREGGVIRVVVPDLEQIATVYLAVLRDSLRGDEEAKKKYDWVMLELLDQMVRNTSGGGMLDYWGQDPMPAESFVIERVGSEVRDALSVLRNSAHSKGTARQDRNSDMGSKRDPLEIGRFRLSGEVHQWMYDRYSLTALLRDAGFRNVRRVRADESAIPGFNAYLLDIEADGSVRKPDSLFMEAEKR